MADVFTSEKRSQIMSAIRSTDTAPELLVRRLVHAMGFRFRLHVRDLPGTPDLVFPRLRKMINVHGCFWHAHRCRRGRTTPASNREFWLTKRKRNVERDRRVLRQLRAEGWQVLTVWQCQTRDKVLLTERLRSFLFTP